VVIDRGPFIYARFQLLSFIPGRIGEIFGISQRRMKRLWEFNMRVVVTSISDDNCSELIMNWVNAKNLEIKSHLYRSKNVIQKSPIPTIFILLDPLNFEVY
jgi:hypothetical protein